MYQSTTIPTLPSPRSNTPAHLPLKYTFTTDLLLLLLAIWLISLPLSIYWSIRGPPQAFTSLQSKAWTWIWARYGGMLEVWARGRERHEWDTEGERMMKSVRSTMKRADRDSGGSEEIELGEIELEGGRGQGQRGVLKGGRDEGWRSLR